MKKALVSLCLLGGCATTPQATTVPEQRQAAAGGAAGCLAHGLMAAASTGKGEMIVANPESVSAFAPRPIGVYGGTTRKGPGGMISRK